jgi:hypothetical protein
MFHADCITRWLLYSNASRTYVPHRRSDSVLPCASACLPRKPGPGQEMV